MYLKLLAAWIGLSYGPPFFRRQHWPWFESGMGSILELAQVQHFHDMIVQQLNRLYSLSQMHYDSFDFLHMFLDMEQLRLAVDSSCRFDWFQLLILSWKDTFQLFLSNRSSIQTGISRTHCLKNYFVRRLSSAIGFWNAFYLGIPFANPISEGKIKMK